MKLSVIHTDKRIEVYDDTNLGIVNFGKNNDYPQRCRELVATSGTASLCVDIYKNFIMGDGFTDVEFYEKNDETLSLNVDDKGFHAGYALHISRDINLNIVKVTHVPFEHCRLTIDYKQIATHKDWGRRSGKMFDQREIKKYPRFSNDRLKILQNIESIGGWNNYKGEILWWSSAGYNVYPTAKYDAVITDISSEDGIATFRNRSVNNNFMPWGAIIKKGNPSYSRLLCTPESEWTNEDHELMHQFQQQDKDYEDDWQSYMGAANARSIIEITVGSDEEKPEFMPFSTENLDKIFEYSEKTAQNNIGNRFAQPPVLRGQLVAGKLATSSEIADATTFYNYMTLNDRRQIERVYTEVFMGQQIGAPSNNYSIIPLSYGTPTVNQ